MIESLDPLCYCACNHFCPCCGPILDLMWLYNAECWEWAGYKAVRQELAKRIMQTSQSTRSRHDGRVSIMFSSLWLTICSAVLWDSGVCCRFLQGNILCISCSYLPCLIVYLALACLHNITGLYLLILLDLHCKYWSSHCWQWMASAGVRRANQQLPRWCSYQSWWSCSWSTCCWRTDARCDLECQQEEEGEAETICSLNTILSTLSTVLYSIQKQSSLYETVYLFFQCS